MNKLRTAYLIILAIAIGVSLVGTVVGITNQNFSAVSGYGSAMIAWGLLLKEQTEKRRHDK